MARIVISIVLSLAILLGSWLIYKKFTSNIEEIVINKEQFIKGVKVAKVTNSVKVAPSVVTNDEFAHVLAGLQVSQRRSGFDKREHSINFWL